MPTFDIVSELDMQEVKNAIDQAQREVGNRFDFKNTDTEIELKDNEITLESATEDRLKATIQVLEEKMVRRKVSLKGLEYQKIEEASKGRARQKVKLAAGLSSEKAKEINKFIKENGPKGLNSQTQGEQIRVQSKKIDDLQTLITALKTKDFGIPLQFENFRD